MAIRAALDPSSKLCKAQKIEPNSNASPNKLKQKSKNAVQLTHKTPSINSYFSKFLLPTHPPTPWEVKLQGVKKRSFPEMRGHLQTLQNPQDQCNVFNNVY